MQKVDISIIVPAYNEEMRISSCIDSILRYFSESSLSYEIIVSDDGSLDGTIRLVREKAASSDRIRFLKNPHRGKGAAVRSGVLESVGDLVLFTDADLSSPFSELRKLWDRINSGYDIAIASRDLPGSEVTKHQSLVRELLGKLLNRIIQTVYTPGIKDTQCGFKLFKGSVAREIFKKQRIDGLLFDVEVLYMARLMGLKVAEVPVRWAHNRLSKVSVLHSLPQVVRDLVRIKALH